MVENRPWLTFFSHAVLIAGVLAVAFPLYVTFVASTLTLEQIMQVPMPLIPGDQLLQNYSQVLGAGNHDRLEGASVLDAGEQHGDGRSSSRSARSPSRSSPRSRWSISASRCAASSSG